MTGRIPEHVNVLKAARLAIIINALELISIIALSAYILSDGLHTALGGIYGDLTILALAVIAGAGAIVDIRDAITTRAASVKLRGLDETVEQMTDLNHALRAQRHDFLNHLQVVYSLMEMKEYDEARRYIDQVYGDIRAVSGALKTSCAPVNALIRAKMAECEQQKVDCVLDVHAAWQNLPLPAWEMCRVLSNLIDNALDALRGQKDKKLVIRLQEYLQYCSFSIENNGPAIPAETGRHIFDAGFSGKGEGRGMGLYIARETLREAGGDLKYESDAGKTRFYGTVPKKTPEEREKDRA